MYTRYIKRFIDSVVAAAILAVAAFPMLVIAVLVKLDSRGPVMFTQQRSGLHGKPFRMYKFRTMTVGNDVHDNSTENQFTRVGVWLRAFSLDELPQLLNVLRGDMSLIGPRPWITTYHDLMTPEQRRRYSVRPGITGIAQVYGRNNLTIHQKINYDLRYVDYIGLREDLKVIFLTVVAVLSREGEEMGKGGIHDELDVLRRQFEDADQEDRNTSNKEKQIAS